MKSYPRGAIAWGIIEVAPQSHSPRAAYFASPIKRQRDIGGGVINRPLFGSKSGHVSSMAEGSKLPSEMAGADLGGWFSQELTAHYFKETI